ncbi:MAG: IS110 family transposase [Spirochaetales bacterium]|nr:IS110 family transposase [Spirochaetales bacterium]
MKCYGIDLHSDSFVFYTENVLNDQDSKLTRKCYLDELDKFKAKLSKDDYVAVEATSNAFWFYYQIKPYVKDCFVLDTNKIVVNGNKTDKIDAQKIFNLLAYYVYIQKLKNIPKVYIPPKEVIELRSLFSTYNLGKKMRTQVKNRIHSIFKINGICLDRKFLNSKSGKEKVLEIEINDIARFQIKQLLTHLNFLDIEQKEIEDKIIFTGFCYFKNEIHLLLTIKGFSAFTAIALLTDIVDVKRFKTAKKFTCYLRTTPRIKSSNKTTHMNNLNRCGRSLTVTLLTQSLLHFKVAGPYFTEFYNRLRKGKSAGKSRLALIRKVLTAAYYMLKRGTEFFWKDNVNYQRKVHNLDLMITAFHRKNDINWQKEIA